MNLLIHIGQIEFDAAAGNGCALPLITFTDPAKFKTLSAAAGDDGKVSLGAGTNVQDGSTITTVRSNLHGDHQWDTRIGSNVTIGHNVALHGCTIEDAALVGMGATLMEGSVVQSGAMVAAGAVVAPETTIPAGELPFQTAQPVPGMLFSRMRFCQLADAMCTGASCAACPSCHA